MAIDFNGTTSKLEHASFEMEYATTTLLAWAFADGQGEGSFGTIMRGPEAGLETTSVFLGHQNAADTLRFFRDFSGGGSVDGIWTFPATDSQWNAVGVSYDSGATTNDPVARVNFASATVTETSTPVGSAATLATGCCVGSNTATTRTWDGRLAHVQVFNVILTATEMDSALRRPGSIRRGLQLWLPLWSATHVTNQAGGAEVFTATALADADGPPGVAPPFAGAFGWSGAHTIPALSDAQRMAAVAALVGAPGMMGRQYV